jgi:hypothetical protein
VCKYSFLFFFLVLVIGNNKLENWSATSIRCAGLCEDHFPQESFTNSATRRLKRDAVPIPFEYHLNVSNYDNNILIPVDSYNINEENTQNENRRKCLKVEHEPYLNTKKQMQSDVQIDNNIASTSSASIFE